ncbi:MAG: hypothetical protein ACOCXX_00780 [Planctomycetota bacterium]
MCPLGTVLDGAGRLVGPRSARLRVIPTWPRYVVLAVALTGLLLGGVGCSWCGPSARSPVERPASRRANATVRRLSSVVGNERLGRAERLLSVRPRS